MTQQEAEILRIAGIKTVNDIKQFRHCKNDGNMLREYITNNKVQSISLGAVGQIKTVVMVIRIAPHLLVADYVYEHDSTFGSLIRIIKDLLERNQNIKNFLFDANKGICEFVLCHNKPGNPELLKMRFCDRCSKAGDSGKLFMVADFDNRPWFIHKLPNVNDKINFLSHEGTLADQVRCNCFFSNAEKRCAHKTLVRAFLNQRLYAKNLK